MNPTIINQNLESRRNDSFYVTFLSLPSNQANVLGRQVKELDFPIINFSPIEIKYKTNIQKHTTVATFDEISIQFEDDIAGITIRILYDILYAQADKKQDLFDIKIALLDHNGMQTSQVHMKECFIQTVAQSQLSYQNTERSNISVTFVYYNIDFGDVTENIANKLAYFENFSNKLTTPPSIQGGAISIPDVSKLDP